MLLSDVLWRVTELRLLQEVELWTLVETRVTIVLVREEQLHLIFVLCDAKLVKFVNQLFLF